tara:strand:- start:54 stop:608 length:555 start_codon:yes stop_codon:yes gene_type:complete
MLKYDPDMIIIGFSQNDISFPSSFYFDYEHFLRENPLIKTLDNTFFQRITLYKFVKSKLYNYEEEKVISDYYENYITPKDNKDSFFQIINLLRKKSINLIILNIPDLEETNYYHVMEQRVLSELNNDDLTIINIIDEYQKAGSDWFKLLRSEYDDDIHPNKLGHELIADRLFLELNEVNQNEKE